MPGQEAASSCYVVSDGQDDGNHCSATGWTCSGSCSRYGSSGYCESGSCGVAWDNCASGSRCSNGSCVSGACAFQAFRCVGSCSYELRRSLCDGSGSCLAGGWELGGLCPAGTVCSSGSCEPGTCVSGSACTGTCTGVTYTYTCDGSMGHCTTIAEEQTWGCSGYTVCSDGACVDAEAVVTVSCWDDCMLQTCGEHPCGSPFCEEGVDCCASSGCHEGYSGRCSGGGCECISDPELN